MNRASSVSIFFVSLFGANIALAQPEFIRVAQETTPGAGDFDQNVLGVIRPWTTTSGLLPGNIYTYDVNDNDSWNGTLLDDAGGLIADRSHLMFAQTGDPTGGGDPVIAARCELDESGICIFWVHDRRGDPDGGTAKTRVEVEGSSGPLCRPIQDDPEAIDDFYSSQGELSFDAHQRWVPEKTDGYTIAGLRGPWRAMLSFSDNDLGNTENPVVDGLTTWVAYSANGDQVDLRLEIDHTAHFRPVADCEAVGWPSNVTTCEGGSATLSAIMPGAGPFAYSWRFNGVPISPASNPTATADELVITDTALADAGAYDCLITAPCGMSVSNAITLTVTECDIGDVTCDLRVDLADLAALLGKFGMPGNRADGDLDGNGFVDLSDLALLLATFGMACP